MIKSNSIFRLPLILATIFSQATLWSSCTKFLEKKPDKSAATISKAKDLQALIDNSYGIQTSYLTGDCADDFFYDEAYAEGLSVQDRDIYVFAEQAQQFFWNIQYPKIYIVNNAIQNIDKVTGTDAEKAQVKGQALLLRSMYYFELAQLYCVPYDNSTKNAQGLPLRLAADLSEKLTRSDLQTTYDLILKDLITASEVLPENRSAINRPDRTAAWAVLARVYLVMRNYEKAFHYADLYLQKRKTLMDLNTIGPDVENPISMDNPEITYFLNADNSGIGYMGWIDTTLFDSYHPDDLRKTRWFQKVEEKRYRFKGSYSTYMSNFMPSQSVATSELYLIRAECYAREGRITEALQDLNTLLKARWTVNQFTDRTASNQQECLDLVLTERRKELVMRNTRWSDMRRLNLEGRNISIRRRISGKEYVLPPNDARWTWLIPIDIISYGNVEQTKR